MTAGPDDGDLEQLSVAAVLARQAAPVTPPVPPASRLPALELSPEVFERLVLEYVWHVEAARDVHVYGRRGQKQYGLDIVGRDREGRRFVYQVRRLQAITPEAIRAAVVDYAGPPRSASGGGPRVKRRFEADQFVLATAASIHDETALVDEITELQKEYKDDLDIQVVGIEHISVKMRDAAGIVAAFFGREWARQFCGVEPPEIPAGLATGFGLLEGPLAELDLETTAAHAEQLRETQPLVAAETDRALADTVQASGYPGHAEFFRHRAGESLRRAGDEDGAFDLFWQLGFDSVLRGNIRNSLRDLPDQTPAPGDARKAKLTVLRAAFDWYGQGSTLVATVPALRALADSGDPHTLALTTIMAEQALVDGLYATDPPTPVVGIENQPANLPQLLAELLALGNRALESPTSSARDWRARLRCTLADAVIEQSRRTSTPTPVDQAYGPLIADVTAGRVLPGPAAVVHARAGRAYAVAGESDKAIDSLRRAVMAALPTFGGDAREAFKSMTRAVSGQGMILIPDFGRISRAVPNRRTFLGADYDPAVAVLDDLRGNSVTSAFLYARRCVWEARLSGHLYAERWALTVFADVLKAADRPGAELINRVAGGDGKGAATTAVALGEWVDLRDQLHYGPAWTVAAAAQGLAAEVDLVPDDAVDPIVGRLLDLAQTAAEAPAIAGHQSVEAFRSLAAFVNRIEIHRFDEAIELVQPHLEQESRLTDHALKIVRGLYGRTPERRDRLTALLKAALEHTHNDSGWAAIRALREPNDALETIARIRAVNGDADALHALAYWRIDSTELRAAARRATAALLRKPVGHPRNQFGLGGNVATKTAMKVAMLITAGDQDDALQSPEPDASRGIAAADRPSPQDEAATIAAGPVTAVATAVVNKLFALATDHYDMAATRADAVQALAVLIEVLPGETLLPIARRLLALARNPQFGPQDDAEVHGKDPLRDVSLNMGGRNLASHALYTAARAYRNAATGDPTIADVDLAMEMLLLGESMLRSDDDQEAETAASALATLAGLTSVNLHRLAGHRLATVRVVAIHGWASADGQPPDLPAQLAADPEATVRRRVAQFANTIVARLGVAEAKPILELLGADLSWSVRYHLNRSQD